MNISSLQYFSRSLPSKKLDKSLLLDYNQHVGLKVVNAKKSSFGAHEVEVECLGYLIFRTGIKLRKLGLYTTWLYQKLDINFTLFLY